MRMYIPIYVYIRIYIFISDWTFRISFQRIMRKYKNKLMCVSRGVYLHGNSSNNDIVRATRKNKEIVERKRLHININIHIHIYIWMYIYVHICTYVLSRRETYLFPCR